MSGKYKSAIRSKLCQDVLLKGQILALYIREMEEHEAPREKSNHDDVETELKMDPDAQFLKKKQAILEACERKDLDRLRFLAESPGGFLSDAIRQQTCKSWLYRQSGNVGLTIYVFQGQYCSVSRLIKTSMKSITPIPGKSSHDTGTRTKCSSMSTELLCIIQAVCVDWFLDPPRRLTSVKTAMRTNSP